MPAALSGGGVIVADPHDYLPLSAARADAVGRARHCRRRCRRQLQVVLTATTIVSPSYHHRRPLLPQTLSALPGDTIIFDPDLCPLSLAALVAADGRPWHCRRRCRRLQSPLTVPAAVSRSHRHRRPLLPLTPDALPVDIILSTP